MNNLFFQYMRWLSHKPYVRPLRSPYSLRLSPPLHSPYSLRLSPPLRSPYSLRLSPTLRPRTFMDQASVYDTHNRVFYIYFLGFFNNRPIYHFGETNDLDANELLIRSQLPFYERILYIPTDSHHNALREFIEYIQNYRTTLPVHNLEHLDAFTTTDIDNGIDAILQKVDNLYHANA